MRNIVGVLVLALLGLGPWGASCSCEDGTPPSDDDSAADDDDADDDSQADDDTDLPYDRLDPPYPRVGIFHWSSAEPEWYAKFDLVVTLERGNDHAEAIRAVDPSTIVVACVEDWNAINSRRVGGEYPSEWRVVDSSGDTYSPYGGDTLLGDITDHCPLVDGQRYNDALIDDMTQHVDFAVYDGVYSDGVWNTPYGTTDVDLDRSCPVNGGSADPDSCNDYDEHGEDWVDDAWAAGVHHTAQGIRDVIGDKILMLNSGRFHEFEWETTNGLFDENAYCAYSMHTFIEYYTEWMATAPEPHAYLYGAVHSPAPDDYAFMRHSLGMTLFGDGYVEVSSGGSEAQHHFHHFYDEFELALGYPTGPMARIEELGGNDEGIYVRFFDHGAVIFNASGLTRTVNVAAIEGMAGYDGPYYLPRGGQNPTWNHGGLFEEVLLEGRDLSSCFIGDAVLLVDQPTTVVTDIYVDNDDEETSPGSAPAELSGAWNQVCDEATEAWDQGCRSWTDHWGLAHTVAGTDHAIFRPTIGVAGDYAVYEWHGAVDGLVNSSSVAVQLVHADGTHSLQVDQSTGLGNWNLLGEFRFDAGDQGHVRIDAAGADGAVVADAVKFVFLGE